MPPRHRTRSEREQLELFRALPGDLAPRDAQDLMAYPFFSLAKTHRTAPIDYRMNEIAIRVEAVPEHGMATIWDADVLIWAASQIVEARDAGLRTSRLMAASPREILTFAGRGTSARDYHRLKAALDRSAIDHGGNVPAPGQRTAHAPLLVDQRMDRARGRARPDSEGIDLIIPDWFYRAVLDDALVLTIDRAYFDLTGGLERWLYRIVRKHGGQQRGRVAVRFPPSPPQIRQLVAVQALRLRASGHRPAASHCRATALRSNGRDRRAHEMLGFVRADLSTGPVWTSCGTARAIGNQRARAIGNRDHVLSGTESAVCTN